MATEEKTPQPEKVVRRFQVRFADGGGEQVTGESAETVREARLKFWNDREIVSVEPMAE